MAIDNLTVIKKLNDITVRNALDNFLKSIDKLPEGYYVKELIPRHHDGGWVVVMEPNFHITPPTLERE